MIDPCLVLAILALAFVGVSLNLFIKFRDLRQDIHFYSSQYQECFAEYQKLRDAVGMERIRNALNEYEAGTRKAGETVDYG